MHEGLNAALSVQLLATRVHTETLELLDELLATADDETLFRTIAPAAQHTILGVAIAHSAIWRVTGDEAHYEAGMRLARRYLSERGEPRRRPFGRYREDLAWNCREAIEAGSSALWILYLLAPILTTPERSTLVRTIDRTYEILRAYGGLDSYINGNYAVPLCELAYGWERLGICDEGVYEHCWRLLVEPVSVRKRWAGYGWVGVARSDASGARVEGHFTETPGYMGRWPQSTFDTDYAQLQLERLARLWLLADDERALFYLHAIHNKLLTALDRTDWSIGLLAASRTPGRKTFSSPATCLLALCKPDSGVDPAFALEQFRRGLVATYRTAVDPYKLRGFGTTLMPVLVVGARAAVLQEVRAQLG